MPTILSDNSTNIQVATTGWTFRVYANSTFHDKDNNLVWASEPGTKDAYISEPLASRDLPEIVLPSTVASIDDPNARYAQAGVYDAKGVLRFVILENFPVPDTDLALTWAELSNLKNAIKRAPLGSYLTGEEIYALLDRILGDIDGGTAFVSFDDVIDGGTATL